MSERFRPIKDTAKKSDERGATYRQIVKVRQEEQDGNERDHAQEDGAHRALPPRLLVDLAPAVAAKGWQGHETPADEIGYPECYQLAICTELDGRECLLSAEALRSHRRLEKAQQRDEERCAHRVTDVAHMCTLEGPSEAEKMARCSLHCAQDLHTLLIPLEVPGEKCGNDDDKEAVRDVCNARIARLHAALHLSKDHDHREAHERHRDSQLVSPAKVAKDEPHLVDSAAMVYAARLRRQLVEAQLGHKLVDEDDKANGGDEAAQEGA